MRYHTANVLLVLLTASALASAAPSRHGILNAPNAHPRPSGFAEADAPQKPANIAFQSISQFAKKTYDITAEFPQDAAPEFDVESVLVNSRPQAEFLVFNHTVYNGHRHVHGTEKFTVSLYTDWKPGEKYEIAVEGKAGNGAHIRLAAVGVAPAQKGSVSASFGSPTAESPYHNIALTVGKESIKPGTVTSVEVDGKRNRDARYFNIGMQNPEKTGILPEGESYEGKVDGSRDLRVVAPVNWINGSSQSIRVTVTPESGAPIVYEASATAPAAGGYWNADWPHVVSVVVSETVGVRRDSEPVHLNLGLFADDICDPAKEIRVVTYQPTHPLAGADGYVVAPVQITNVVTWRDGKLLNSDEKDPETHEPVHRYDATTSVELVFLADVQQYEQRVYQVVYGNSKAEAQAFPSDLKVAAGEGLSATVENQFYRYYLSKNSGSVETITILGAGEPVVLEHKLETNGAVHWNPDFYSPPNPWVHASDWEGADHNEISGPIMHRTSRSALLPHLTNVMAGVSYEFYAEQPYLVMSSYMEVQEDLFVQALRNAEIVFNHAVLNEFVWENPLGKVESLNIDTSRKHPIHALEVAPDTPWMAFVNREAGVGFANILLAYENGNRYGLAPSETQPYFYVQNGPWIYWSRPIVYPFGGLNFTRMMPVRKGSFYYEKNAWIPFRFAAGDDPFAEIKRQQKLLTHPLHLHEWMATDARTPDKWVMPILTAPFNEGVAGAVSGHKKQGK